MNISKELLCNIFRNDEYIDSFKLAVETEIKNERLICYEKNGFIISECSRDILRVMIDCMIFCSTKLDYSIVSTFSKIDNGWILYELSHSPFGLEIPDNILEHIYDTPYEPIFKLCQWILENLNDNPTN